MAWAVCCFVWLILNDCFSSILQTPEWFRHEQHIILAESGVGLGCGCSSGFCHLQSCCQTEMINNQLSFFFFFPPPCFYPSIKTKPPRPEPLQVCNFLLFTPKAPRKVFLSDFSQWLTSSLYPPFWVSWSQLEASDHVIPQAAVPSFFCLILSNQAK